MEWGKFEKFLNKVAQRSPDAPEALRVKPTLNIRTIPVWNAFTDLANQRQHGANDWQALTTESIIGWLALNEIRGEAAREFHLLISRLDQHWREKVRTTRGKSQGIN